MQQRPKASNRTVKNIQKWFSQYPQAITIHERSFLEEDKREDLVSTTDRAKTPLRRILERTPLFYRLKPFRFKVRFTSLQILMKFSGANTNKFRT